MSKTDPIINTGLGAGGLILMNKKLKKTFLKFKILLTDYYPNTDVFKHALKQADNLYFIKNTVDSKISIAVFEAQERNFTSLPAMFFSRLSILLLTPFIKPFKFVRLLFTYSIIPVISLFVWWDGMVSSLRTYSVKEMEALVSNLKNTESDICEINKVKSGSGIVLYLVGISKETR